MIGLRNESQQNQRKKLNLKHLSLQSTSTNFKSQKSHQKQTTLLRSQSLANNQHILYRIQQNQVNQQFQRKRSTKKLTQSLKSNKKLFSKSMEKQNNKKSVINRKTNKNQENIRISPPFPIVRTEGKKLSLQPKVSCEKRQLNVIELLNYCQNKFPKPSKQEIQWQYFTENNSKLEIIKQQDLHSITRNKPGHFEKNQSSKFERISLNPNIGRSVKIFSLRRTLQLSSKVTQICITPWEKSGEKVNKEIQTIQNQSEYFEYLVYKRKKQQYESALMDLYNDVSIVNQDRKQFMQRKNSILQVYNQQPQDQREKRVFKLKEDINKFEQNLQHSLKQTLKKQEVQLKQVQQIQLMTLSGINKVDETLKNYLLVFKQAFKKISDTKYVRIVERLENLISNILLGVNKQINHHIKKAKHYKQQSFDLKHTYNEFISSNNEYKQLLKNCFQHLKKAPELCYELFGDTELQTGISLNLINEKNEFEKPKCVHCFNTRWKLYTIVQQNIVMKSVLKVSQELLK